MARQGTIQERISQIETSIVGELDQIVELESNRLVSLLDTERLYLQAVLDETANEITLGGDLAAARVMRRGWLLADEYREKNDPPRAARVEQAAMGCHDQMRDAAKVLADRVRAYESSLSAPLHRAKREALNDKLPGLKRVVEEAARRTGSDLRRKAAARVPGTATTGLDDEIEQFRRQLVDGVRQTRTAAKERVDTDHRRARAEVERVVEELAGLPGPVKRRLYEVVDPTRIDPLLRQNSEGRAYLAPTRGQRILRAVGAVLTVVFVFLLGIVAMGMGIGLAAGLFLALALRGSALPVEQIGGMMIGLTGATLGALITDVLFGGTGDWKTSVRIALFGAHTPLEGPGAATRSRDLANTLQYIELPPLSPDRVATAAAPGALRVALDANPGASPDVPERKEVVKPSIRIQSSKDSSGE